MSSVTTGDVQRLYKEITSFSVSVAKQVKTIMNTAFRYAVDIQDLDYICCSAYGRPRSKNYHFTHYKNLLRDCGLPDIGWHDLRSTFCTLLLKNNFNPKAVSKLMGHAKEIITIDVYGDNKEIISDGVPEIEAFMENVLPDKSEHIVNDQSDIMPDVTDYYAT